MLSRYVESDGRVVRHDEGGDVVSEGQAYGMLIAAASATRPDSGRWAASCWEPRSWGSARRRSPPAFVRE
nr:glycosyl hydrolase family 8 [Mycolicibacterium austroafricanum]